HLDEPRLCRGPGDAAQGRDANAYFLVRWIELRHRARRQAGVFRAVSPGSLTRPARLALSVRSVCGFDAAEQAGLIRTRHCEERSDEAIHSATSGKMDCFASLAMT